MPSIKTPIQSAQIPALHPVYLRLLCDALRDRNLDVAALLAAAGLSEAQVGEAASPIGFSQVMALLRMVGHQCGDPLLPIDWGRRIRPNAHGFIGTAIFSSTDLRKGLQTAAALTSLRSTAMRLSLIEDGARARLEYEEVIPLYGLREFVLTAIAFMAIQVIRGLVGRNISRVCVEFPFPAPIWADDRKKHCPSEAIFGAPRLAFSMPIELLDRPIASADSRTHEAALRQSRIDMLGVRASMSAQVIAFLADHAVPYPSLDETAGHFCMSSRTLRRVLQGEGHSYQQVFDLVRMEAARHLLKSSELSVQQITERLGYADPSNFVRAFRRHHGHTPHQYRNLQL